MRELFDFLQISKSHQYHWSDINVCIMAKCMQKLVFTKTHLASQLAKFFFVSIDETINVDCQGRINVHVYVVEGWECIPILLTLEQMVVGAIINNLIKVIVIISKPF